VVRTEDDMVGRVHLAISSLAAVLVVACGDSMTSAFHSGAGDAGTSADGRASGAGDAGEAWIPVRSRTCKAFMSRAQRTDSSHGDSGCTPNLTGRLRDFVNKPGFTPSTALDDD